MKKSGKDRLKCAVCESTLSIAGAVPLPQWGRQRNENTAFLDTTPFLMGKAKRRRLRRKKGSQPRLAALGCPFQGKGLAWTLPPSRGRGGRMPPHRLPTKKAYDTRMPFSPYCHFERKREIFFVCGQAKDVRIAASGKHRASSESEGRCFMQTALRKKTETGNEKDPSAALGMTKRGNASFHSFSTCCESQPPPRCARQSLPRKGAREVIPALVNKNWTRN